MSSKTNAPAVTDTADNGAEYSMMKDTTKNTVLSRKLSR